VSLAIEGPSKADIECTDVGNGICRVTYIPTAPGIYVINIRFADKLVPGKKISLRLALPDTVT
jgi:filamin